VVLGAVKGVRSDKAFENHWHVVAQTMRRPKKQVPNSRHAFAFCFDKSPPLHFSALAPSVGKKVFGAKGIKTS